MNISTLSFVRTLLLICLPFQLVAADEPDVREVELAGVKLSVPKSWKQQQPSSRLRLTQFEVPAGEGESAELAVFQFTAGGSAQAQVARWKGQFEADGLKFRVVEGESRVGKYIFVDASGTHKRSVGPPVLGRTKAVPNSRMLAAMLPDDKQGNLFLKMVGPAKAISEQVKPFRAMFAAKPDTEKPFSE